MRYTESGKVKTESSQLIITIKFYFIVMGLTHNDNHSQGLSITLQLKGSWFSTNRATLIFNQNPAIMACLKYINIPTINQIRTHPYNKDVWVILCCFSIWDFINTLSEQNLPNIVRHVPFHPPIQWLIDIILVIWTYCLWWLQYHVSSEMLLQARWSSSGSEICDGVELSRDMYQHRRPSASGINSSPIYSHLNAT